MRAALVIDAIRTPFSKRKATGSLAAVHPVDLSHTRLDDRTATCLSELPTDLPHQMTVEPSSLRMNETEGAYMLTAEIFEHLADDLTRRWTARGHRHRSRRDLRDRPRRVLAGTAGAPPRGRAPRPMTSIPRTGSTAPRRSADSTASHSSPLPRRVWPLKTLAIRTSTPAARVSSSQPVVLGV